MAGNGKAKEESAAIDNPADGLAHASLLSKLTFRWVFTLIALGRTRPLVEGDLPQTPKPERASALYESLESRWQHELQRSSSPSFARALFFNMLPALVPAGLTALGNSTAKIAQALALGYAAATQICRAWLLPFPASPQLVALPTLPLLQTPGKLVNLLARRGEEASSGEEASDIEPEMIAWAAAIAVTSVVAILCHQHYFFMADRIGLRARVATVGILFHKSLRLSMDSLAQTSIGHVVTLASSDVEKFQLSFAMGTYLWLAPLEVIVVLTIGLNVVRCSMWRSRGWG